MPYAVRLQRKHQLIEIRFTGAFRYQDALSARQDASRLARGRNVRGLLVDQSEVESFPGTTANMFDFHTSHDSFFPPGFHTALVYSPATTRPADARFAETVALNQGIPFATFTFRQAALEWLLNDPE